MARESDHDRIVRLEAEMEHVLPAVRGICKTLARIEERLPPARDMRAEHDKMQRILDSIATSGATDPLILRDIARQTVRYIGKWSD